MTPLEEAIKAAQDDYLRTLERLRETLDAEIIGAKNGCRPALIFETAMQRCLHAGFYLSGATFGAMRMRLLVQKEGK